MIPRNRCLAFPTSISRLTAALACLLLAAVAFAGPSGYTVTVTLTPADGGTVAKSPDYAKYKLNNIVTLTATPASGYVFSGWSGAVSGATNPITLRVSGNATVNAAFAKTGIAPSRDPLPMSNMIVGYFAQWTIYQRNYLVKNVETSGSAGKLNVINYAFAAPDASLQCVSLDTFADWGKAFSASESVDGVADVYSQPLKGNFNQLLKLKRKHPNLRVLLSLGGWTGSTHFSAAAKSENRVAFVKSCIDLFMRGRNAGVFDGFDIDWEYPGSAGATNNFSADDVENFPALLEEFRRQLHELAEESGPDPNTRPQFLLTAAVPAGQSHYLPIDVPRMAAQLDWVNVMAYDFHGPWETSGPANHHAPLRQSPCDGDGADWGAKAIEYYLAKGVLPSQLLLGVPFYGHGWKGVAAVGDGTCQPATGLARGKYESGTNDYKLLDAQGRPELFDATTVAHWTFNGSEFWSYDDTDSLAAKAAYVNATTGSGRIGEPLRGVMFWELSGDSLDTRLLTTLRDNLPLK
jgi:chitinase